MIIFDNYTNENKKQHNSKWPHIPDHPYRILIVGGSGSGKTNALLNLINNQQGIDKIYLYVKDPYEAKHQYFINKREKVGSDNFKDLRAFIEYSNDMQDVYNAIENYNPNKKRKILIVFDDMIADMINNKKLNPVVTELFIRGRKLNISIAFITQSYNKVPKDVRLNSTHFFIMKIPNRRELQQIALNHSSDIDFKDFMKIYKKCTTEPYSFLVNDTALPSDDPLIYNKIMTIEDQIGDEKLQFDINREAAKIAALSSGKIDKYEYLTCEEILPSTQQQIIEQAKFTYSPLRKAFEKQIKTIKDQGEEQIKAIQDKELNKSIKDVEYGADDGQMLLRQKEIYNELTEEKKNEIEKLDEMVNRKKLLNEYKVNTADVDFISFNGAIDTINKIASGDISLSKAIDNQYKLKSELGEVKKRNSKRTSSKNLEVIKNAANLYI